MKTIIVILVLFASLPSEAGSRACNASLVSAGVCAVSTDRLIFFSTPAATEQALVDALAVQGGYEATILCTDAAVKAALCVMASLGTRVPNPLTKALFAQIQLARLFNRIVDRYRTDLAEEAARAGVTPADIKP